MKKFKSVLFRPHRCLLSEAMSEVVIVFDKNSLVRHLNSIYKIGKKFKVENITIEKYGYDARIKWETFIVCDEGNAIGFTNGNLE